MTARSTGSIVPGQYQDFSISVDPLPTGTTQLVFKAVQTYSNGDVVRWIDLAQAGQPDPDHPAPVLALTQAGGAASSGSAGSGTGTAATTATAAPTSNDTFGIAGLIVGALGLLTAGFALWRTRSAGAGDGRE